MAQDVLELKKAAKLLCAYDALDLCCFLQRRVQFFLG